MKETTPRQGSTHRGGNHPTDTRSGPETKHPRNKKNTDVRGGGEMPQTPGRPQREDDDQQFHPHRHDAPQPPIEPEQEPDA